MIDIVGSYKLSADGQSKAAAARARVEAERAERRSKEEGGGGGGSKEERQMAAQMRRMEKLAEERVGHLVSPGVTWVSPCVASCHFASVLMGSDEIGAHFDGWACHQAQS